VICDLFRVRRGAGFFGANPRRNRSGIGLPAPSGGTMRMEGVGSAIGGPGGRSLFCSTFDVPEYLVAWFFCVLCERAFRHAAISACCARGWKTGATQLAPSL